MKKLVLVIAIAAIFAMGSMVYAGQFGPPEPAAKEGKVSLGVGYFYSSAKWKSRDGDGETKLGRQDQTYLQIGYSPVKNIEAYLRVGGANLKIKDAFTPYTEEDVTYGFRDDFRADLKPFGTIGIKGVFNISPSFGIGPFLQASLYSAYKDKNTFVLDVPDPLISVTITEEWKIKSMRELNLGLGLQAKIGETIIYGGPVVYWTRAKVKVSTTVIDYIYDETETSTESVKIREKNNLGGFAGVRLPLSKGLNLEVEGQYKSRFSFGGALTYSF